MRLQSQVLWKGWPPGIPALQLRGSPGPDDGGGARCSWPMADLLPLFCVCFVKGWGSLDLCFSVCFVKGWGSLGLCFSLFLLPISEEETIKRRRPIVQFMEEPKKSEFLVCRHLEDKLVFITIHFSLTLPQSEVPVIGEGDSRGRVGLLTIWWSCIQLKGALTVAWVRCLTC